MSNPNLKFMAPFPSPSSYYESDGIHLNQDAGNSFIYYLVTGCDQLFPPEMDTDTVQAGCLDLQMVSSSIATLSKSVVELRSDVDRRRLQDNLIFARIKEDRDHDLNRAFINNVLVSKLRIIFF